MCGDIGIKAQQRPDEESLVTMDVDTSMCGSCELYGWHSMLGAWQVEDGWCKAKMGNGNLSAKASICDYFLKRKDV